MDVLHDPSYPVVRVPHATRGVAWLRSHVARFSEGEDHVRRRKLAEDLLAGIDPASLRRPGAPVASLAAALGLRRSVVTDVRTVAGCYQPHIEITSEADDSVARLVAQCGGEWDEATAARIGLLVQAHDATRALIAGVVPPVPATRRIDPSGNEIMVNLADAPFGAGRHACPGRDHAGALAAGALAFHRLHDGPDPLVLPNAWDVASAAVLLEAGFAAIGTTSLGVAAAHGLPDAAGLARDETLALARRLAGFPVPVTVDIEAGFGDDPVDLAAELSEIGIAGVNIEDGRGNGLAEHTAQARLIAGLKRGAPELFVNARVDTYWLSLEQGDTLERAQRYLDAGADGVFVPGLAAEGEIERLAQALAAPLNVLAQLPVRRLADLGVRRVSTGSLLYRAALLATAATASAVRDSRPVGIAPTYEDVQRMVTRAAGLVGMAPGPG